jgi:HEAT repeat protein
MVELLESKNLLLRKAAVLSLSECQPKPLVIDALVRMLRDENQEIRASAAASLGKFGPASSNAVPALIISLGDTNRFGRFGSEQVRTSAAAALGEMGLVAYAAIPNLTAALSDADEWSRETIARAIKQIDPNSAKGQVRANK